MYVRSPSPYPCPEQQEENPVLRLVRVYSLGLESGAVPPALLPLLARHLAPLLRALKHAASASTSGTPHPSAGVCPLNPFVDSQESGLGSSAPHAERPSGTTTHELHLNARHYL
jgi:hypothetical protein